MLDSISYFLLNYTPLFYWTQSVWRDEAFSVWIAKDSLSDVIVRTSGDFNPPLYYLLLNMWMKLFGTSEVAARSLSLVFFVALLMVTYKFARVLFKEKSMAIYTTVFMALNPMLLYFAFELRMYSLLMLLTGLSTYLLYTKQWKWYVLAAAAGMYTQPFMAFVIMAQGIYFLYTKNVKTAVWVYGGIALLYLPWVPSIIDQFKHSGPMWMWPVDATIFMSVLGNVFMGYEGTPGGWWNAMKVLSLIFIGVTYIATKQKKIKDAVVLFSLLTFFTLGLVLLISLKKPIYVHRYVIFAAVGETFLMASAFSAVAKKYSKSVGVILVAFLIGANIFAVTFHRKVDFRKTFADINAQLTENDSVYANGPLSYYESWYYTKNGTSVYLYNPQKITMPRYVGSVGMPESTWAPTYPHYPKRAFVVNDNGTYMIQSIAQIP